MSLIKTEDIYKIYEVGDNKVYALNGVSVHIEHKEFVAVMGQSGSGKSTFMNVIGCLDVPSSGTYLLDDIDVGTLNRDELSTIRNIKVGFIFQGFNLLPKISALENVELPMLYNNTPPLERKERAIYALEMLGLKDRIHHSPLQLSGGQQQRVAIARALVNNAPLILADEPTGNLDTKTSNEIMELLTRLNEDKKVSIVLVTHEPDIANFSKRIIKFIDGKVISDERIR